MSATQEILSVIDDRLGQARREIASLERTRSAMEKREARERAAAERAAARDRGRSARSTSPGSGKGQTGATRSPSTRNGRGRRPPRRSEIVPAGKLEALLGGARDGGLTTSDLADRSRGDREQVLTLLREMEAAGTVRRSGQRRGTRWHLITDEDRIAARVAELERASRRRKG